MQVSRQVMNCSRVLQGVSVEKRCDCRVLHAMCWPLLKTYSVEVRDPLLHYGHDWILLLTRDLAQTGSAKARAYSESENYLSLNWKW